MNTTAAATAVDPRRPTTRTFNVDRYRVIFEMDAQGGSTWSCPCADFKRLTGTGAHCSHVAIAIDQAMEETTDKVYWHTQRR